MPNVAVVTDSTVNIPDELIQNLSIHVVPLQVIWGPDTYRDSVDIHPSEFYQRLQGAKVMPSTSQPSPAAFSAVYGALVAQGFDILSIHISSSLSGTMDSALQARKDYPKANISIVDSRTTSMGMGFPVLLAARAAAQGATLQECQKLVENAIPHTGVFFVVRTLEYLRRGGRIGGAAAFVGTALDMKPILELRDGRVEAINKVRTMSKALDQMLDLFTQSIGSQRPVHLAVLHANTLDEALQVLERAKSRFAPDEISEVVVSEVSPVIGIHAGPGVIGLVYLAGE